MKKKYFLVGLFVVIIALVFYSFFDRMNNLEKSNSLLSDQLIILTKQVDQKINQLESHLFFTDFELPDSIFCLGHVVKRSDKLTWEKFVKALLEYRQRPQVIVSWIRNQEIIEMQRDTLIARGLPGDLAILRCLESAGRFWEISYAWAVGPDQFTAGTGRMFGLYINTSFGIDQRFDPRLSGSATAKYCEKLYKIHNDWFLVLGHYNLGDAMSRIVLKNGFKDFFALRYLNRQTQEFVPYFLAAWLIYNNYEKMGFGNVKIINYNYAELKKISLKSVREDVKFTQIVSNDLVDVNNLYIINPSFIYNKIPKGHKVDFWVKPQNYKSTLDSLKNIQGVKIY